MDSNINNSQKSPDKVCVGKVVKVFIMLGQSNMLGFGRVQPIDKPGTLANLVINEGKYRNLLLDAEEEEADGNNNGGIAKKWTTLDNVRYVQVMPRKNDMAVLHNEWLTVAKDQKFFGPELGFGHVVGPWMKLHNNNDDNNRQQEEGENEQNTYNDNNEKKPGTDILLLKSCIGNRSLGWDLLPPKSKRFEHGDKIYAGYKDDPASWSKDPSVPPKPSKVWYAGKQYDTDTENAKTVLSDIGKYYPGAVDYEIVGFVWWQGHKDQYDAGHAARYEHNLVRLISALREEFEAPEAKFVIATVAFGGHNMKNPSTTTTILEAQMAVSGETGNRTKRIHPILKN